MEDQTFRDFFLGFIKIHILYHASREPVYGQEFADELRRHGYTVSFGTLYPIFHRLQQKGFLIVTHKNIKGKIRKYYTITREGKKILKEAKRKAAELVDELHEN
ncbi:MAG TPA: PadR family transcriptional regulator [bacterium]|nr:PadR family transcriptional regulator [bacterium]